jgi:hypothetical protein
VGDREKHLGAVVPWPYPPDGALQFYRDVAIPQMERGEAWHWTLRLKTAPERIVGALSLHIAEQNLRTQGVLCRFLVGDKLLLNALEIRQFLRTSLKTTVAEVFR